MVLDVQCITVQSIQMENEVDALLFRNRRPLLTSPSATLAKISIMMARFGRHLVFVMAKVVPIKLFRLSFAWT